MFRDYLNHDWPKGVPPDESIVQTYEKVPWRWLLLAGFALARGATFDDTHSLDTAEFWYLLGLAALAAFVGDWVSRLRRNRQRHRPEPGDPSSLIQVLRDYGVDEWGGLYLYLPVPERPEDGDARAWFRALRAKGLIVSGPWRLEASRSPPWLRKTHPKLWSEEVAFYDVYRLKKDPLSAFF